MYIEHYITNLVPGEPHLGATDEYELVVDDEEIIELLAKQTEVMGEVPESVIGFDIGTGEEIHITVSDYIDDEVINRLSSWLEQYEDNFPTEEEIRSRIELSQTGTGKLPQDEHGSYKGSMYLLVGHMSIACAIRKFIEDNSDINPRQLEYILQSEVAEAVASAMLDRQK